MGYKYNRRKWMEGREGVLGYLLLNKTLTRVAWNKTRCVQGGQGRAYNFILEMMRYSNRPKPGRFPVDG